MKQEGNLTYRYLCQKHRNTVFVLQFFTQNARRGRILTMLNLEVSSQKMLYTYKELKVYRHKYKEIKSDKQNKKKIK